MISINWITDVAFPSLKEVSNWLSNSFKYFFDWVVSSKAVFFVSVSVIFVVISAIVSIFLSISDFRANTDYPQFRNISFLYWKNIDSPYWKNMRPRVLYSDMSSSITSKIYGFFKTRKEKKERDLDTEQRNAQIKANDALVEEFFENNPTKMMITLDGKKYFADNWYKKNWGNRVVERRTVTRGSEGQIIRTSDSQTTSEDITHEEDLY